MIYLRGTPEERLLNRICALDDEQGGCWVCDYTQTAFGYSMMNMDGKIRLAHRVAYEIWVGPIAEGLEIDHLCRRRDCVRPEHLEAVTPRENWARGDNPTAINARKTHCNQSHELTPENVRIETTGSRRCRICERTRNHSRKRAVEGQRTTKESSHGN